jgi:transcriptional regulator with XRE-family HTH domain
MSRRSPERGASTEALLQKTFALNLRAARKSKGMTQAEVAKAIGVSTTVFWRYEGARMWPSIETLRDMCKVLDVSADALLGLGQEETPGILPAPPENPPMVRRLLDQLRRASRSTRYLVEMVLAAIEKRRGGQP